MAKFNQKDSKNDKKQIWMYAVILFTGAFIILLLTAYSQVKFQNNINEFESKLSTEEKAKINVVSNLNSVLKENEKLKSDVDSLKDKMVEIEEKLALQEEKNVELEERFKEEKKNSDLLFSAFEYYDNGEYIDSAIILKYDINIQYLSEKAVQSYHELSDKVFEKAAKMLYLEGYRSYKKNSYQEAIVHLNRAIDLAQKDEYYIDDAYFFLAKCYYATSNFEASKEIINKLMKEYPNSSLMGEIKKLLNSMG